MRSDRSILEREMELVELRPFTLEGFHRRRERKQRNRKIGTAAVALVLAAASTGLLVRSFSDRLIPAGDLRSPLLGTWVTNDSDGSSPTLTIRVAKDGAVEIVVRDDLASVCTGASSTMTGTGRLEDTSEVLIPSPVLTCNDGTEPQALSGLPLDEQLRNLTFVHDPGSDALTDSLGQVWQRKDGDRAAMSGGMWPQSNVEELRKAQSRADAGDPRFEWQVLPNIIPKARGQRDPRAVAFFTRFLQEELGWEKFRWSDAPGLYAGVHNDWPWEFVAVRCAPGRTNPLYPNDIEGRGCAPTIDEHRYETVKIGASQPAREGPAGMWVVTRWMILPPSANTHGLLRIAGPGESQRQVQQLTPPSDAEATEALRAFLEARVKGDGAERYLHVPNAQIPLLYATTSGVPYERSELELVQGPVWPGGWMEYRVRLFAEGGSSVVEQPFVVDRGKDDRLVLLYGTVEDGEVPTTENGVPLAEPYEVLDGQVSFGVPPPWYGFFDYGPGTIALVHPESDGDFAVLPDPLPVETGCKQAGVEADAHALARRIRSDPDLEATAPVVVTIGGTEALRMDLAAAPGASVCENWGTPQVLTPDDHDFRGLGLKARDRMRLYLLDLPEDFSARTLAIAFAAPEASFEAVLEDEARILGSFKFQAG